MQIKTAGIWGWRWIFIVEGALTIVVGLVAWFFLVDFPQRASFLDHYQRARVIERLNDDRGDGDNDAITREKVLLHLRDLKLWGFALIVRPFCSQDIMLILVFWNNCSMLRTCLFCSVQFLLRVS
jgi:MFS family permease